jgi:hypothetical protein
MVALNAVMMMPIVRDAEQQLDFRRGAWIGARFTGHVFVGKLRGAKSSGPLGTVNPVPRWRTRAGSVGQLVPHVRGE